MIPVGNLDLVDFAAVVVVVMVVVMLVNNYQNLAVVNC